MLSMAYREFERFRLLGPWVLIFSPCTFLYDRKGRGSSYLPVYSVVKFTFLCLRMLICSPASTCVSVCLTVQHADFMSRRLSTCQSLLYFDESRGNTSNPIIFKISSRLPTQSFFRREGARAESQVFSILFLNSSVCSFCLHFCFFAHLSGHLCICLPVGLLGGLHVEEVIDHPP